MTQDQINLIAQLVAAELRKQPPAVTAPATGPLGAVDWHKVVQTVGTLLITLVVIPVLGYYGYNLPGNVRIASENAVEARQQSAETHAQSVENADKITEAHRDLKQDLLKADAKVDVAVEKADDARRAAEKPRPLVFPSAPPAKEKE